MHLTKWDFVIHHNFANGSGGNAVAILGLLELLDGNGFRGFRPYLCQENQPVCSFPNFPNYVILLQPLRLVAAATTRIARPSIPHLCSSYWYQLIQ
ncbi:hypothetical protein CDL12_09906 [Handroanthus impetiginosus]|uniref:Uncharacterized protein n=1 Tax=Handroanthus impetiginosus TaxID=429701 RepID=A0A2G9HIV7_9LAMI|nr:hypothetical protein CDL12_09906 [Handroanthus impetiginosus]